MMSEASPRPFDIVTACRLKDLPALRLAWPRLQEFIPHRRLFVFTSRANLGMFRKKLGSGVEVVDEDQVVPNMTLSQLRQAGRLPGFPAGAGWYFQQFLKYSYPCLEPNASHYLIWDADTIPLRPIEVFSKEGKALLAPASLDAAEPLPGQRVDRQTLNLLRQATRLHAEYFDNYQWLVGEEPDRGCSFISQHMPIRVDCLKSLLCRIEGHCQGKESWAWKIVQNLKGNSQNLFSEYEFYAQFALEHFPQSHQVRTLSWRRGGRLPKGSAACEQLRKWGEHFDFVSLEGWASPWRRMLVDGFIRLPPWIQRWIRRGV